MALCSAIKTTTPKICYWDNHKASQSVEARCSSRVFLPNPTSPHIPLSAPRRKFTENWYWHLLFLSYAIKLKPDNTVKYDSYEQLKVIWLNLEKLNQDWFMNNNNKWIKIIMAKGLMLLELSNDGIKESI